MKKKLQVDYHFDRLELVFEIPQEFDFLISKCAEPQVINDELRNCVIRSFVPEIPSSKDVSELWNVNAEIPRLPFLFILAEEIKNQGRYAYRFPNLNIYVMQDSDTTELIGTVYRYLEGAITVSSENWLLYSGHVGWLHDFESAFNLKFWRIKAADIACDATNNLPRKLNDTLHQRNCQISRKGRNKEQFTAHGNIEIGGQYSKNLKLLTKKERQDPTYDYSLHYSGNKKPIKLRAYNKTREIEEKSKKYYIATALGFPDQKIYRLEVSLNSYFITKQSDRKNPISHQNIFENLDSRELLRSIFLVILNKFFSLKIDGKKRKVSEILRLEYP